MCTGPLVTGPLIGVSAVNFSRYLSRGSSLDTEGPNDKLNSLTHYNVPRARSGAMLQTPGHRHRERNSLSDKGRPPLGRTPKGSWALRGGIPGTFWKLLFQNPSQNPTPILDKIPGPMDARFFASVGLGFGTRIGRTQLFPTPALDKIDFHQQGAH